MRPLRIVIPGEFWDSQVYMGRLYLWDRQGDVSVYDWRRLIDSLSVTDSTRLALVCAFLRSDLLYRAIVPELFQDQDVVSLLRSKFEQAGLSEYTIDDAQLSPALIGKQSSPFPFPHADSLIYAQKMFGTGEQGLYRAGVGKKTKNPISTRVDKLWDGRGTGLAAAWASVAVAAGADGLWELGHFSSNDNLVMLCPKHASACEYLFYSIFASSQLNGGYLADYDMQHVSKLKNVDLLSEHLQEASRHRMLSEIREAAALFPDIETTFAWGNRDKLCALNCTSVTIEKYIPWSERRRITRLGSVPVTNTGGVVSARTAVFGVIIEWDDDLTVLMSDSTQLSLGGSPVSWRIFPRSRHYENQLHVIADDRLEVVSFNQDYFVSQTQKILGSQFGRVTVEKLELGEAPDGTGPVPDRESDDASEDVPF